jgi:NitT/TauT family transport system permease protein
MASTDTAAGTGSPANDLVGLEAGLDALNTRRECRCPVRYTLMLKMLPPLLAGTLVLASWQALVWARVTTEDKLPPPSAVLASVRDLWLRGELLGVIWTSVSRGLFGFLLALSIGTAVGLLVARVWFIRAAVKPVLSGLQSLPSVAWVPPAVIWLGLNNTMMYAVILLGAVPSVTNGLIAGIDQIPPLYLRAGRTIGATGLRNIWHIVLPAALPGYLAGLKQGWSFSWRSLMAAEIIASSPDLGIGLGQLLENGRTNADLPGVFLAIILILAVGITIDVLFFGPLERRVLRSRGLFVERRHVLAPSRPI